MAHKDVAVLEEEEDLGAVLQRLEIPFKQLEHNSFDSTDDGFDGFLNYDSREFDDPSPNVWPPDDPTDLKPPRNSSNSASSLVVKRPRNKRGRRKRLNFESAVSVFGSDEVEECKDKWCLHCGTRNTPMWREGPKGPGTLCNACGVRYRTGRLLPEYRPASSPDFKPNVHSNFHRKVMEIRREKNPPPNSFGFEGFQH